jgi:uncharacterized protein (TIGR03435 family)
MANRNGRSFVKMLMRTTTVALAALLLAQAAPRVQFEVASVKPNTRGGGTTRRVEPQTLTYLNITLGEFIQMAYGVRRYQVQGEDWITAPAANRYDIVAKAAAPATEAELQHMLAPLLEDRFHLKTHRETRVLPVYVLVQAKGGAKVTPGNGGAQNVSPDPAGGFRFRNYPIGGLLALMSAMPTIGRPVIDRTGLTGRYDFSANLQDLKAGASTDDFKSAVIQSDTPVFARLEEQLGLKLNAGREPIELLIIDHAERVPTED